LVDVGCKPQLLEILFIAILFFGRSWVQDPTSTNIIHRIFIFFVEVGCKAQLLQILFTTLLILGRSWVQAPSDTNFIH